jgi:S1-C subfamily serine protease
MRLERNRNRYGEYMKSNAFLLMALATISNAAFSANLGDAIPIPNDTRSVSDYELKYDSALAVPLQDSKKAQHILNAMSQVKTEEGLTTRGSKEIALFKTIAPSVVLIISEDGTGTGSIINISGQILTNWHVVKGSKYVDIIYKPDNAVDDDLLVPSVRAKVVRVDELADLALLQPIKPNTTRSPLRLAQQGTIPVGTDTHAIGHPLGYTWTYTQGIVSQYRVQQNWHYDIGYQHVANVVQTQTPINPGNSGGPLLNDAGEIIGVNSYRSSGESINFAVSIEDVNQFLARKVDRKSPKIPGSPAMGDFGKDCKPKSVDKFDSEDGSAAVTRYDYTCDGIADGYLVVSYDETKPVQFLLDTTGNGKVDVRLVDVDRDEAWDVSFYDTDGDGNPNIVGYHNEESVPYQFVSYARFQKQRQN